jgi:hypothetical protein
MKKTMLWFLLLLSLRLSAQHKTVDSKISHVTVFLNKAQIERVVKTRVEAGKTDLIVAARSAKYTGSR